jgi:serpin B
MHSAESERLGINAWVSSSTAHTINDLLPPKAITTDTRIVLVNAVHLKFRWATPFGTATPGPFTKADGSTVQTPFMGVESYFPMTDDGQATIVGVPLAGSELTILLAMPHSGVDLGAYEARLSADSPALVPPASQRMIRLSIPKLTFTSPTFSLTGALKAMGMLQAFDPHAADLSGMSTSPAQRGEHLYVEDVWQKAMVEMKETGVEAAAATAVTGPAIGLAPPEVDFDRPYLVSIVDAPTRAILFLGRIEDPTDPGTP